MSLIYDIEKARRHNRAFLALTSVLLVGAVGLVISGYRGLVGWMLLTSCAINLMSALAGRRALSRAKSADKSTPVTQNDG